MPTSEELAAKYGGPVATYEKNTRELLRMAAECRAKVAANPAMEHSEKRMNLESAGWFESNAKDMSWFYDYACGLPKKHTLGD